MWARIVSLYNRIRGRRYWQAVSPYGNQQLGFLTTREAVALVRESGGHVTFVDQKWGVVIYDSHMVPQQREVH